MLDDSPASYSESVANEMTALHSLGQKTWPEGNTSLWPQSGGARRLSFLGARPGSRSVGAPSASTPWAASPLRAIPGPTALGSPADVERAQAARAAWRAGRYKEARNATREEGRSKTGIASLLHVKLAPLRAPKRSGERLEHLEPRTS